MARIRIPSRNKIAPQYYTVDYSDGGVYFYNGTEHSSGSASGNSEYTANLNQSHGEARWLNRTADVSKLVP